jgi:hypothetical protein
MLLGSGESDMAVSVRLAALEPPMIPWFLGSMETCRWAIRMRWHEPRPKGCEKELEKTPVNFEFGPSGVLEDEAVDDGNETPAQSAEGVAGCRQRL